MIQGGVSSRGYNDCRRSRVPDTYVESNACVAHALTKQDVCDADCPASAAFMTVSAKTGLALFFCSHHYNENMDALKAQGFTITDKAGSPA